MTAAAQTGGDASSGDVVGSGVTLAIRADPLRRFHQTWAQAKSAAERAREEFAELLLRNEIATLRPPSLPATLSCSASLTAPMIVLWHTRADLQSSYDLATVDGYFGMIAWFVTHGRREYPAARPDVLASVPGLSTAWPAGGDGRLTQFGCVLWLSRPDLQRQFALNTEAGRAGYAEWFLKRGVAGCDAWPVLSAAQSGWLTGLESPVAGDRVPVARFLLSVWSARPDLQAAFSLTSGDWGARLWIWFLEHGVMDLDVHPDLVVRSVRALEQAGVRIEWT